MWKMRARDLYNINDKSNDNNSNNNYENKDVNVSNDNCNPSVICTDNTGKIQTRALTAKRDEERHSTTSKTQRKIPYGLHRRKVTRLRRRQG